MVKSLLPKKKDIPTYSHKTTVGRKTNFIREQQRSHKLSGELSLNVGNGGFEVIICCPGIEDIVDRLKFC